MRRLNASLPLRVTFLVLTLAGCARGSAAAGSPDGAPPRARPAAAREALPVFAAIYRRGPAYIPDRTIYQQPSIPEHVRHHEALGPKLIAAGALRATPDDEVVGLIVFEADDARVAEEWLRRDPAVLSGVLTAQVRQWGLRSIRAYPAR